MYRMFQFQIILKNLFFIGTYFKAWNTTIKYRLTYIDIDCTCRLQVR